jgi:hypothetical protein
VATGGEAPFVLCGSVAHLLDRRQVPPSAPTGPGPGFYTTALLSMARRVAELPDEAARSTPPLQGIQSHWGQPMTEPGEIARELGYAVRRLSHQHSWWAGEAVLSGHARVLAAESFVLATPLYVEYEAGPAH